MKIFIVIISAATAVLAFYKEARRAGFVGSLNIESINLPGHKRKNRKIDEDKDKKLLI